MRESEFIRRVAEAESVIRYTFRLEIPEAEQRLKGNLVACSLDQAYRMTESLFSNYWKNRPFHINDPRKELFEVKRRELLSDAAVPELYCMVRKIIGEENTMTVYAAGEYAFFDAKAFDMGPEADDILSNFVTGMDDLFNRRIYTFENDQSLTINKKKLEVKGLGEKLGSRNQPLKKTVNNVDTKLSTLLPAYQSFFFEEKNIADEEEMDCWSNWIFPIFTSCFCVVLSKNIKEEQSKSKKNDAKEVSIMYKELSDYINKNNLKMSAMTFDDELLSNARKNSIMRNMISDYLMDALQEKRRLPIPITLKEVNEIMPKRSVGKGLKEAII